MSNAHGFSFPAIDGGEIALKAHAGKPILIVNTASECGFTPQYAGLQQLHEQFGPEGLVVIGVPSNDFGAQEPGDDSAIASFCETRFGVSFPLTAKQKIIGEEAHPLYGWLLAELGEAAEPRWNFTKILFDGAGNPVDIWPSQVDPMDPKLTETVRDLL